MSAGAHHPVHVFINHAAHSFERHQQTGQAIKERAGIPLDHILCIDRDRQGEPGERAHQPKPPSAELVVVDDRETITLKDGQHFFSHAVPQHGVVIVTINLKQYEFSDAHQSGRALKERAGIALADVLFLNRPHEDEVIPDDQSITLKRGEVFHSAPPANYGKTRDTADALNVGFERFDAFPQPDGWTFLVIHNYPLPDGFTPSPVRLLVKLPPLFPEAAPDMFWVSPHVQLTNGCMPQGTSTEQALGEQWQRFSWHLLPGAWLPGTSTLRDYMRCIRARLERKN